MVASVGGEASQLSAAHKPPATRTRAHRGRAQALRWDGYTVASVDSAMLVEVGLLRRRAYVAAGKAADNDLPMVDPLDSMPHVTHLLWRDAAGQLVAAVRLAMPQSEDEPFDLDHAVDLAGVIPRRDLVGEASRLVADPVLRSKMTLAAMTAAVSYELVTRGRSWVLLCADVRLGRFYEAVGCHSLQLAFDHPELAGCRHDVFVGPVRWAVERRIRQPFVMWACVFAPTTSRLLREQFPMRVAGLSRLQLRCADMLARAVRAWVGSTHRRVRVAGAHRG